MEKTSVKKPGNFSTNNSLPDIEYYDIVTKEDVLRAYKILFKKIERILLSFGRMSLYDFRVGDDMHSSMKTFYFYPGENCGFISSNGGTITKHELEEVLEDLYSPKEIAYNLIWLLKRLSLINQKKMHELPSLDFLDDLLLRKIEKIDI